jgi:hypothetical protein
VFPDATFNLESIGWWLLKSRVGQSKRVQMKGLKVGIGRVLAGMFEGVFEGMFEGMKAGVGSRGSDSHCGRTEVFT